MPRMAPVGPRTLMLPPQMQPPGGDTTKSQPDNDRWSPIKPERIDGASGGQRSMEDADDRRNHRDADRHFPDRKSGGDRDTMMDLEDTAEGHRGPPSGGGRSPRMVSALMSAMSNDPRQAGPGGMGPLGGNGPMLGGPINMSPGGRGGPIRQLGNQPRAPMLGFRGPPNLFGGPPGRGGFMPARFERADMARPPMRMRGEEGPRDLFPGPPQGPPGDPRFMFHGGFGGMMRPGFRGPSERMPGPFQGGPVPSLTDMPRMARFGGPPRDGPPRDGPPRDGPPQDNDHDRFGRDHGEPDGMRGPYRRGDSRERHERNERSEHTSNSSQRERRDRDGPRRSRWGNWQAENADESDMSRNSEQSAIEGSGDSCGEAATKDTKVEASKEEPPAPADSTSTPPPAVPSQ